MPRAIPMNCKRGHRLIPFLPHCLACEEIERSIAARRAEEARLNALMPKRCPKGHRMIAELHIRDCPTCLENRKAARAQALSIATNHQK